MSLRVMSRVWDTVCESHTQKLVLLALADNANDEGKCWPSIATIASKCQLSMRCVYLQLDRLEVLKWVDRVSGGGNQPNHYTLRLTPASHSPLHAMHPTPAQDSPLPLNTVQGTPARRAPEPSINRHIEPSGTINKRREEGDGEPKPPFEEVRLRLCALFKRKPEAHWGNDEEHYLGDVVKRADVMSELSEIEAFCSRGEYPPQCIRTLLRDWTNQLDRARKPDKVAVAGNGRPPTVSELRTACELKQKRASALKDRYCTETGLDHTWMDEGKRQEYLSLRKEIKELETRIETTVNTP